MANNSTPTGQELKFYINTAGALSDALSSSNWVEIDKARLSDATDTPDQVDVSARDSSIKQYIPGMREVGISVEVVNVRGDSGVTALRQAADYPLTEAAFMVLDDDKDTAGATGFAIVGYAYQQSEGGALADASTLSYEVKPTRPAAGGPNFRYINVGT